MYVCVLCLSKISEEFFLFDYGSPSVESRIKTCFPQLNIEIFRNGTICRECNEALNNYYDFRTRSAKSINMLHNYIEQACPSTIKKVILIADTSYVELHSVPNNLRYYRCYGSVSPHEYIRSTKNFCPLYDSDTNYSLVIGYNEEQPKIADPIQIGSKPSNSRLHEPPNDIDVEDQDDTVESTTVDSIGKTVFEQSLLEPITEMDLTEDELCNSPDKTQSLNFDGNLIFLDSDEPDPDDAEWNQRSKKKKGSRSKNIKQKQRSKVKSPTSKTKSCEIKIISPETSTKTALSTAKANMPTRLGQNSRKLMPKEPSRPNRYRFLKCKRCSEYFKDCKTFNKHLDHCNLKANSESEESDCKGFDEPLSPQHLKPEESEEVTKTNDEDPDIMESEKSDVDVNQISYKEVCNIIGEYYKPEQWKIVRCPLCMATFKFKNQLNNHMKEHSNSVLESSLRSGTDLSNTGISVKCTKETLHRRIANICPKELRVSLERLCTRREEKILTETWVDCEPELDVLDPLATIKLELNSDSLDEQLLQDTMEPIHVDIPDIFMNVQKLEADAEELLPVSYVCKHCSVTYNSQLQLDLHEEGNESEMCECDQVCTELICRKCDRKFSVHCAYVKHVFECK